VVRWLPELAMSRSNEHIHGSRRLHRALGLGLSGLALVGLVYFEGMSARAETGADEADEIEVDEAEAEGAEISVSSPSLVAAPPSGAAVAQGSETLVTGAEAPVPVADGRIAMAAVADADAALPAPPAPALVVVPDIEGKSLRKARKELKALGLKLSVRDGYNEKIPREYWSEYKVRSQKIEAGTEVEAGSTVKVKARMIQRYAMGY
jgi:hypothetical protein